MKVYLVLGGIIFYDLKVGGEGQGLGCSRNEISTQTPEAWVPALGMAQWPPWSSTPSWRSRQG